MSLCKKDSKKRGKILDEERPWIGRTDVCEWPVRSEPMAGTDVRPHRRYFKDDIHSGD